MASTDGADATVIDANGAETGVFGIAANGVTVGGVGKGCTAVGGRFYGLGVGGVGGSEGTFDGGTHYLARKSPST